MNNSRLRELIQSAAERGILPKDAMLDGSTRAWPIVLMTGIGAWLAAVPLCILMFLIFKDALLNDLWCYILGSMLLAGALIVLHKPGLPIFVEQLSLPGLLVGGALISYGAYRDMPQEFAGILVMVIGLIVAWLTPQNWLRTLLGAFACFMFVVTTSNSGHLGGFLPRWSGIHYGLLAWLLTLLFSDTQQVSGAQAANMITVESIATGWVLWILFVITQISGPTFLAGRLGDGWHTHGLMSAIFDYPTQKMPSVLMTLAAAVWLAYRWPVLRAPRHLVGAAMLAALAWLVQTLGAAFLVLAVCVVSGRWRLAAASAVAASWVMGTFYYQLDIPLATKAIIMTTMGAAFGLIAWRGMTGSHVSRPAALSPMTASKGNRWQQAGIAASLLATLVVANTAIWQKEELVRTSRPVFLEVAPVDPRSLMQGDYMALNFKMPWISAPDTSMKQRVLVIAKIDARGVAVVQGIKDRPTLASDEILIELKLTQSGLRPASDAWYFKEGEGDRWSKARYGEFRIDRQGQALLVGLRGSNLEKL